MWGRDDTTTVMWAETGKGWLPQEEGAVLRKREKGCSWVDTSNR